MSASYSSGPEVSTIGKYQLIANLGHGGMADVYLSVVHGPVGFNKLTVVKRLRPSLADEPEFLAMFLDEARLAARLNHPNVVQTNEVSEVDGIYYIAMEYLDGQPLNRIIHRAAKNGDAPRELFLRIVADALAGLHHAHELADYDGTPLCVVHRDSSPHNIFVTYDGQTKVVDFGIAKAATRSAETRGGVLKGKIAYMAPEQARSDDVDRRSDVFAMGLVLWEVLTLQRLRSGSEIDMLDNIARGDVPALSSKLADCPPALEKILARATALSKVDRYATANDMRQDILAYLDTLPARSSQEDVGSFLSALFEGKRAEMRALIERQLSGLRRASTEDVGLRIIDARRLSSTDSMELPRVTLSSNPSLTPPASTTSAGLAGSSATGVSTSTPPSNTVSSGGTDPSSQQRSRSRAPLVIALAALVAGVTVLALRNGADPQVPVAAAGSTSATTTATASATAADSAVALGTIQVRLSARPELAKLFLDDTALDTNPFVGRFRRDDKPHTLRVEAEGFASTLRSVSFGTDVTLEVALDRVEPTKTNKPTGTLPPASTADLDPDGPARPPRPKKPLDGDDPWK